MEGGSDGVAEACGADALEPRYVRLVQNLDKGTLRRAGEKMGP